MKKLYLISAMLMIFLAAAVAANVDVTYYFWDIEPQQPQPLNDVDVLVYPCLDSTCDTLMLGSPLPGSGNSGMNTYLTIIYPTNLVTPYGYAAYYFAHGYAPQEYLATWADTGATPYNINFNKIANCQADVINVNTGITYTPLGAEVFIIADIESAFSDPQNNIGYILPQYADEFYSSLVEVTYRIYDSSNDLVYEETETVNIFMDNIVPSVSFDTILQPGDYRAEVETIVIDDQCSNSISSFGSMDFTVQDIPECNDGFDNDGDGLVDLADPGCDDINDDNETDPIVLPECSDLMDNDGDLLIDVNDPGCYDTGAYDPLDDNETDTLNECSDFFDNDGDGLVDLADPGCDNINDDNETDPVDLPPNVTLISPPNGTITTQQNITFVYQVFDDVDNIVNCTLYLDDGTGFNPVANDIVFLPGTYNFNIGLLGYGNYTWNVLCEDTQGNSAFAPDDWQFEIIQTTLPECSDLMDNDGDLLIDINDPGCYGTGVYDPLDDNETDTLPECSDFFDNDGDGLIDWPADPGCTDANDDNETDQVDLPPNVTLISPPNGTITTQQNITFEYQVFDDIDSITNCTLYLDDGTGFNPVADDLLVLPGQYTFNIGLLGYGNYTWNVLCEDTQGNSAFAPDDWQFEIIQTTLPECSDLMDNDGDLLIDINDPGCYGTGVYDPLDDNETDTLPECSDFFDNDGDGLIDWPADPGCTDINDDNETDPIVIFPECSDGIDNDGDGLIDFPDDPGCDNVTDDDETDGVLNDNPIVVLFFPFNGMVTNESDMIFMYMVFDDSALWLNCTLYTDISGTFQPEQSLMTLNGFFGLMYEQNIPDGTYTWNVMCEDEAGNQAFAPENWTFTINSSAQIYQCNDGIDNDGDNLTDYPADPGCDSPTDNDETDPIVIFPECNDGVDNDGDGLIDFPADPGCDDINDNDETDEVITLPECSDGIDNDGDGLVDMADPDCQSTSDNTEFPDETLHPDQLLYIGHIDIHSTTNMGFEQEVARAGDEVEITVYLENLADYDLEDLKLRIYIDELGVWRSIGPFDLNEGERTTKHVYIDIPEDSQDGDYDVRIVVENQDIKRVKYRVLTLI